MASEKKSVPRGHSNRTPGTRGCNLGYVKMKAMPSKCWDAVVFDYGRVLSHAPTPAEVREFGALVGVSEPPFFQLYSEHAMNMTAAGRTVGSIGGALPTQPVFR